MKKIHFWGDSTLVGYTKLPDGTSETSFWNVPDVAKRFLEDRFGAANVTVVNKAVSGTRIEQWVSGEIAAGMPSAASRLSIDAPDIVVFEIGLNNASQPNYNRDIFLSNLQALHTVFRNAGKILILCTPNPALDTRADNLYDIQNAIRDFATKFRVPLIDHYKIITGHFENWPNMISDFTHPVNVLYSLKGTVVAMFLMRYLP